MRLLDSRRGAIALAHLTPRRRERCRRESISEIYNTLAVLRNRLWRSKCLTPSLKQMSCRHPSRSKHKVSLNRKPSLIRALMFSGMCAGLRCSERQGKPHTMRKVQTLTTLTTLFGFTACMHSDIANNRRHSSRKHFIHALESALRAVKRLFWTAKKERRSMFTWRWQPQPGLSRSHPVHDLRCSPRERGCGRRAKGSPL